MSFPRYPKYKPSGVEWLGDVPDGWTVRPLKTIASGAGALFIDGDWIESKDISNAGIRYLTSGNVGDGFYKEQGQGFITDETFNELKCTEVLPGDLLISRLNVPIGRACIVPDLGSRIVTCVDNVVVRPASIFNRQFCVFLLSCKGHLENTEILGRGATMPRLSRSALGRLPFAFPSLPEQTAIAEFLDRETGKIDELVAEQRRLMELLKEKRQAVNSHAVTKGLNPHAPMKPSGIEWLGDVPEGWELKPLRSVFKFSKGLTITKENLQDEGVYCVNYGEVHSKYGFRLNPLVHPLRCVAPEYLLTNPDALIRDGDFVFADTSEDLEGSGNFTHLRSDDPIFAGYHTIIARPRKDTCSLFLAYQLHSSAFRSQIQRQVKGVKVFSISQGILKAAKCLMPPLPEQTAIAEFLEAELAKFDTLTAEAQRAIDLLQERRTALISAAVTGQIDVRQTPKN